MLKHLLLFILFLPISSMAQEHLKAKSFKQPLRELSVIAGEDGFYPSSLVAFKGERVRFFVTSTTSANNCFLLQKHKVFLAAQKGKVSEAEVVLEEAGSFKFYCPAAKFEGQLTVLEKENKKETVRQDRKIASEKPNYWTPRNYD